MLTPKTRLKMISNLKDSLILVNLRIIKRNSIKNIVMIEVDESPIITDIIEMINAKYTIKIFFLSLRV
jgi:hypothetical protein